MKLKSILILICMTLMVTGTAYAADIWSAAVQTGDDPDTVAHTLSTNYRQIISNAAINDSSSGVKVVLINKHASSEINYSGISICELDSVDDCVADSLMRVTYNGINSQYIAGGDDARYASDCMEYAIDSGTDYFVTVRFLSDGGTGGAIAIGSGTQAYRIESATDYSQDETWSGSAAKTYTIGAMWLEGCTPEGPPVAETPGISKTEIFGQSMFTLYGTSQWFLY